NLCLSGCREREGTGVNPFAFCDLPSGNGSLSFLLIGNSYAANIGPIVQQHFTQNYSTFHSWAIPSCEPFFLTSTFGFCVDPITAQRQFNSALETVKPDVLFIMARYLDLDTPIDGAIDNDFIFTEIMRRMKYFET
ncbi:hypothetical protein PMAYCL1PPCAC_33011, partial [Pristionchus mayeri]